MKDGDRKTVIKDKPFNNEELQRAIAAKTTEFLQQGGQIQQIPKGISGQLPSGKPKAPKAETSEK